MPESRKKAVSLRISTADLRKVKILARRLGVRDSDITRFAVKTMLARIALLCDERVRGRALLPAFQEAGSDLIHHFDLDTARLEEIVNDGAPRGQEVKARDLERVATTAMRRSYAKLRQGDDTAGRGSGPDMARADDARGAHLDAVSASQDSP